MRAHVAITTQQHEHHEIERRERERGKGGNCREREEKVAEEKKVGSWMGGDSSP